MFELIDEVLNICRPLFASAEVTLNPINCERKNLFLLADRKRCKQVLLNLVSNAVKFTPQGGQLNVAYHTSSVGLEIRVADSGVGVPAEALERVFERYEQARLPVNQNAVGTGLGLALVKNIMSLHQGKAWASVPGLMGKGTTFHVLFPNERIVDVIG